MTTARLTRKEGQAQTRAGLMRSAARLISSKGLERASIDEIAAGAGFTKGAFYANFESKEAIVFALLDERIADRIAETREAFAHDEPAPDQARGAAAAFARVVHDDPDAPRLFLEVFVAAQRDARLRARLVKHFASLRDELARVYSDRARDYGLELEIPMDRVVRMVIAICDGWKLWHLLEPEEADELMLEQLIQSFIIGLAALSPRAAT